LAGFRNAGRTVEQTEPIEAVFGKGIKTMKAFTPSNLSLAGCLLLASALQSFAIEGLKLTVHCPDVWLSWPSVEGEN
jgi:hypothetical protein